MGGYIQKVLISLVILSCFIGGATIRGGWAAGVKEWSVGGPAKPWADYGELVAVDDFSFPGAIQPRELMPWVNILAAPGLSEGESGLTSLGIRSYRRRFPRDPDFEEGLDMHFWIGTEDSYGDSWILFDGNAGPGSTYKTNLVPWSRPRGVLFAAVDLGVPLPLNRVEFYPPQRDELDTYGNRWRDNYSHGYIVSGSLERHPTYYEDVASGAWRDNPMNAMLERILEQNPNNFDSIVEVHFPLQYLRYLRALNLVDHPYAVAEVEAYGQGFAPKVVYTSEILDLEEPVNFGRFHFTLTKWRQKKGWTWEWDTDEGGNARFDELGKPKRRWEVVGGDPEPVPLDPDAPSVWIQVETRSGSDDTPLVYHVITEVGGEKEVSKEEYRLALPQPLKSLEYNPNAAWIKPGMRAVVTYDDAHWSTWSASLTTSGEPIQSPGPRRYFQFRITLRTRDFWAYGRLEEARFEYSPPLADRILGEVGVWDEPTPPDGIAHVEAAEPTSFTYDLRAEFGSSAQEGFNGVALALPSRPTFEGLEMGEESVGPGDVDVRITSDSLIVHLPRAVTPARNEPIRIRFTTSVFLYGTRFTGEVFNTESATLPQEIWAGDANEAVSTDKIGVLVSEVSLKEVLENVRISPEVFTPNGDGRDDEAEVSYAILRVTGVARAEVGIYDLGGRRVNRLVSERASNGPGRAVWDGRDEGGELVIPGIYFCEVLVTTDTGVHRKVRRVAVVY